MKCRFCKNQLVDVFLNLGYTPLANSYLKKTEIDKPELRGRVIDELSTLIYNSFNREKIEIPFPQRTVHIKKTDS